MAFWWVNHKKTRDHEVRGGYLWSPMRNSNGAFNQAYENMTLARPGDIVFSYAHGEIGAIGQVTESASVSPKPSEFGSVGDYWSHEGWLVGVYFTPAPKSLRPKTQIELIAPLLPARHSPIKANGHGNEFYLAAISDALGYLLLSLLNVESAPTFFNLSSQVQDLAEDAEIIDDIHSIEADSSILETQRLQLVKARIGQGLFRKQVMLIDPRCRVTGVDDVRLLIASHIKPWRDASNAERISGHNGLMLSPHVDALFDERLISFEDDGQMLVHRTLPQDVLDKWSIPRNTRTGKFRPEQARFLSYHRQLFAGKAP